MRYVGLDVHWKTSSIHILDENGKKVKAQTIRGGWEKRLAVLAELPRPWSICYEASCGYGALYDRLRRLSSKVHVPAPAARAWRELIEFRCRLVEKRVRVKNALRALLRSHGIAMPRSLWSRKGLVWLAVSLLQTIPGIGPRTAEAVAAYIDRPERFTKNHAIGAYFGLAPCQDASAGVNRLGHITREGPATVRKYLTEAAWRVTALDPTARAFFDRIAGGKKDRRKIALVATAHWLLRCMLSMLQTGECWRHTA